MEVTQYNKNIAIIGAGGFGREIESWFSKSNLKDNYNLVGYLDDNPLSLVGFNSDLKIIGGISLDNFKEVGNVIIAISNKEVKQKIVETYEKEGGFNILQFSHVTAIRSKFSKVGLGFIATPNTIVSCNTDIGKGVFINSGTQIGHDVTIGDYVSIMASVNIGGGAKIGNNVFIGTGSVILPGVKVADNVRIGAGAVILRNIRKEGTYFGNPAKKIF